MSLHLNFFVRSITCLAERFAADNIYTWVGASKSVLVSLNPFKSLPIYTPKTIAEHATPPPNKLLAPHVFDIAAGAWKSLIGACDLLSARATCCLHSAPAFHF